MAGPTPLRLFLVILAASLIAVQVGLLGSILFVVWITSLTAAFRSLKRLRQGAAVKQRVAVFATVAVVTTYLFVPGLVTSFSPSAKIVGRWQLAEGTAVGPGSFSFRRDGTVTTDWELDKLVLRAEGTWTVQNNTLTVEITEGPRFRVGSTYTYAVKRLSVNELWLDDFRLVRSK